MSLSAMMGTNNRFLEGFFKSWGVILASEIGDKTFFIAAVMAMRNSRKLVFAGAIGALAVMTVLSALLGWAAPNLVSRPHQRLCSHRCHCLSSVLLQQPWPCLPRRSFSARVDLC
jgi:putative Ca2+/H+ antiporter (TMEM165/GDT1 family)